MTEIEYIRYLFKTYKPPRELMDKVYDIFIQGDSRYSDPWNHIIVAGFIANDAISISSKIIEEPQSDEIPNIKGPQQDLKRIAVWLLRKRGFKVKGCEITIAGGLVDVLGIKEKEKILVECGPCRINKPIGYLENPNHILWVLTRKNDNIVLHEVTRGRNWDDYSNFHKEEEFRKIQEAYDKAITALVEDPKKQNHVANKPQRIKFPRVLSEIEIAKMFKAAEGSSRDCMLLKCLYYLGLKSSNLRNLRVEDIDTENSVVRINGKKQREVMIPGNFSFELKKYMDGRGGLVFTGRGQGETISDRHIRRIVKKYACLADVRNCEEIKPHTLRISYANHLRKDGIPLKTIQEMLGHTRKETTYIYTHGLPKIKSDS